MTLGIRKKPHQGDNLVLARKWKKMTQADVADKIGIHQTEISTLEKQEKIDDILLDRISQAMDIPVSFLTDFDLDDTIRSYNNTNTNHITAAENSSEWVSSANNIEEQNNINEQKVTYYPLDDVKSLYERLLSEKESKMKELQTEIDKLRLNDKQV
jgi:Helix-turn-helix.